MFLAEFGIPMKVSFFMFRLLLQKLPLGESLTKLGFHGPSKCYCCSFPALETFDHVFSNGDLASSVWNFFGAECGILPSGVSLRVRLVSWWYTSRANPVLA